MTRDEMKDWLVDNDIDYLMNTSGGLEWIRWRLAEGFPGYDSMTDAELKAEILERDEDAFTTEDDHA